MKLSIKSRYGLRALVDLAVNYSEQVFSLLKKVKIIKSVKGAQGGYMLTKLSEEVSVGEIICAIEEEILIVDEKVRKNETSLIYQNMQVCLQRVVWDKITQSVNEIVDQMTLEDLMKDYHDLLLNDGDMYYI